MPSGDPYVRVSLIAFVRIGHASMLSLRTNSVSLSLSLSLSLTHTQVNACGL